MRYITGAEIRRGDRVSLSGRRGVVVLSVDGDDYSDDFPRDDWAGLKQGVLVEFEEIGLMQFYGAPDPDLEFLGRG